MSLCTSSTSKLKNTKKRSHSAFIVDTAQVPNEPWNAVYIAAVNSLMSNPVVGSFRLLSLVAFMW